MVLPLTEQPGNEFRIDDCASQIIGWLLPIGVKNSIQKKKRIVVKNSLICTCKSAQEVDAALFNAEWIIKYSEMFSAVIMPTNCPACVTGRAGMPDS